MTTADSGGLDACRQELDLLVRARYSILWLCSHEESRAEALLAELAHSLRKKVYGWTVTRGFGGTAEGSPLKALEYIAQSTERALFVLKDFHPFLDPRGSSSDPAVVRALRDLVGDLKQSYKTVVILSPRLSIPLELEKEVTVVDLPLPDHTELMDILARIVRSVEDSGRVKISPDPTVRDRIVQAALGLTAAEAENVFSKAIVHGRALDEDDISLVLAEKKQILRKSGLLEFYEPDESLTQVGGLDSLKEWLVRRESGFTEAARRYGLPYPKGLLLLGVQGCGKSLCAKAVAAHWWLPLLRLDMGRLFGSFMGESESNLRKATAMAESLSPCVLWLDEIEKAFSGVEAGGRSDAGVGARIFGAFLTWLQEKSAPVFVIATSNNVEGLPPELLRKGRFDEIFFVDLPRGDERAKIFAIHLAKRGRDAAAFDLSGLATASDGFSGAEIEQAVVEAMFDAFAQGREVATGDVVAALEATVPLSRTSAERIARLRDWAGTRARPAASPGTRVRGTQSTEVVHGR